MNFAVLTTELKLLIFKFFILSTEGLKNISFKKEFKLFATSCKLLEDKDLQMYVNNNDRVEKLKHENKTIGILLCAGKNDSVVKFTLPENEKNIILSQYKIYP